MDTHRADIYRAALDKACSSAGLGDDGWNDRFRVALRGQGLGLFPPEEFDSSAPHKANYPEGWPFDAPAPYEWWGSDNGWPQGTLVAWRDWPHSG